MPILLVDTERHPAHSLDLGAVSILTDNTLPRAAGAWQQCVICDKWEEDSKVENILTVEHDEGLHSICFKLRTRYAAYRCASCINKGWSRPVLSYLCEPAEEDAAPVQQLSPVHVTATYTLQGDDAGTDLCTITQEIILHCPDCAHHSPPLRPQLVQQYIRDHLSSTAAAGQPCSVLQRCMDRGIYADPAAYGASSTDFEVPYTIEQALARSAVLVANYVLARTRHAAAGGGAAGIPVRTQHAAASAAAGAAAASSDLQLHQLRTWAIKTLTGNDAFLAAANYVRPHLHGLALDHNPSLLHLVLAPPYIAAADLEAGMTLQKLAVLLYQLQRQQQKQKKQQQQRDRGPGELDPAVPAAGDAGTLLVTLLKKDSYFRHLPAGERLQQFLAVLGISSIGEVAAAMQQLWVMDGARQHLKVCADCGWDAAQLRSLGLPYGLPRCSYCLICSGCAGCKQSVNEVPDTAAAAAAAGQISTSCRWCKGHPDLEDFTLASSSSSSGGRRSKGRRRRSAADGDYTVTPAAAAAAGDSGTDWGSKVRAFDSSNTVLPWNQGRLNLSAQQLNSQCQQLGLHLTPDQSEQLLGSGIRNRWTLVNPPSRLIPPGFVMILVARNDHAPPDPYYYAPDGAKLRSGPEIRQWVSNQQQDEVQEMQVDPAAAAAEDPAAAAPAAEDAPSPKRPRRAAAEQCGQKLAEWAGFLGPAASGPSAAAGGGAGAGAGGGGSSSAGAAIAAAAAGGSANHPGNRQPCQPRRQSMGQPAMAAARAGSATYTAAVSAAAAAAAPAPAVLLLVVPQVAVPGAVAPPAAAPAVVSPVAVPGAAAASAVQPLAAAPPAAAATVAPPAAVPEAAATPGNVHGPLAAGEEAAAAVRIPAAAAEPAASTPDGQALATALPAAAPAVVDPAAAPAAAAAPGTPPTALAGVEDAGAAAPLGAVAEPAAPDGQAFGKATTTPAAAPAATAAARGSRVRTGDAAGHSDPTDQQRQQQQMVKQEPRMDEQQQQQQQQQQVVRQEPGTDVSQQQQQQQQQGSAVHEVIELLSDSECDTEDNHLVLNKPPAAAIGTVGSSGSNSSSSGKPPGCPRTRQAVDRGNAPRGAHADQMQQQQQQQQGATNPQQQSTVVAEEGGPQQPLQSESPVQQQQQQQQPLPPQLLLQRQPPQQPPAPVTQHQQQQQQQQPHIQPAQQQHQAPLPPTQLQQQQPQQPQTQPLQHQPQQVEQQPPPMQQQLEAGRQYLQRCQQLSDLLEKVFYDLEYSPDPATKTLAQHETMRQLDQLTQHFCLTAAAAAKVHFCASSDPSLEALGVLCAIMQDWSGLEPDRALQESVLDLLAQDVPQQQQFAGTCADLQGLQDCKVAGVLRLLLACWLKEVELTGRDPTQQQGQGLQDLTANSSLQDFAAGMTHQALQVILQGCKVAAAAAPAAAAAAAGAADQPDALLHKLAGELLSGTDLLLTHCQDKVKIGRWRSMMKRYLKCQEADLASLQQLYKTVTQSVQWTLLSL